ncbi:hypothetical protein HG536_0C01180 [Torulaspora globosa]|uniref:DOD-type homing endonuclease domain-containing protein n=1 Tax=Torulaspora globosa TaxID=48254 RepID=A0A7G3ZEL4_9SACH|nr:uncharacterized protein HG536_0C01180 [Torulaspora globosa]QLL31950.1 hypothetical protein HG536_0C01180 [Torulaspora globosa]
MKQCRLMNGDPEFIGGLVPGTKIFLANWKTVPIEVIKVGDEVLTSNGGAAKVEAVLRDDHHDLVTIRQNTRHRAHLKDPSVEKPWGIIEITCSKRQKLVLSTKQRIKISKRGRRGFMEVSVSQLADRQTKDGRIIKIIKDKSRRFPLTAERSEIIDYVKPMVLRSEGRCFTWQCEAGDLVEYVNKKRQAGTRMILQPFSIEIPVLGPWLQQCFGRNITAGQLEAMAWLLGFWIGDGCREGAKFALNSEDDDVNTRLEENAKVWGMTLRMWYGEGRKASGFLHTYTGAERLWNVNNPLVKVLEGLRFYENGKRKDRKNVPLFMRTEEIVVREAFLAGLIDSDGYCDIQDGSIRVIIPTAYPPIRDGMRSIGRSLGLNVSTSFRGAHFYERHGQNKSDTWTFYLSGGTNDETLRSILNRCSCERKRNPKIQYCTNTDFEEFDSDYQSEENENDPEDNDDLSGIREGFEDDLEDDPEEQQDGTFNFGKFRFEIIPGRKDAVIGLVLSGTSNRTFVTDDQIVCASAELSTERLESRPYFRRRCLSCRTETTPKWCKVPWLGYVLDRICLACSTRYSRTHMRCSNDLCNWVFRLRVQKGKKPRCKKRQVAKIVTRQCERCGSTPLQEGNP